MIGELHSTGSSEEMRDLLDILVRTCGCGCSSRDGKLLGAGPDCFAERALAHRRFVLGLAFGRHLRAQLDAEERTQVEPHRLTITPQTPGCI